MIIAPAINGPGAGKVAGFGGEDPIVYGRRTALGLVFSADPMDEVGAWDNEDGVADMDVSEDFARVILGGYVGDGGPRLLVEEGDAVIVDFVEEGGAAITVVACCGLKMKNIDSWNMKLTYKKIALTVGG